MKQMNYGNALAIVPSIVPVPILYKHVPLDAEDVHGAALLQQEFLLRWVRRVGLRVHPDAQGRVIVLAWQDKQNRLVIVGFAVIDCVVEGDLKVLRIRVIAWHAYWLFRFEVNVRLVDLHPVLRHLDAAPKQKYTGDVVDASFYNFLDILTTLKRFVTRYKLINLVAGHDLIVVQAIPLRQQRD